MTHGNILALTVAILGLIFAGRLFFLQEADKAEAYAETILEALPKLEC